MHVLICFEGIDYTGKTTIAKIVADAVGAIRGPRVASGYEKEEAEIHKNPDHLARFSFFVKEIAARSTEVCQILERAPVVLDRYLLSVFAYHNVIVGRRLEGEIETSGMRQPDLTALLTVDGVMLRRRMNIRPPRHLYESDPVFLLGVQREFLRLADSSKTFIVDTSIPTAEEVAEAVTRELTRRGLVRSHSPKRE